MYMEDITLAKEALERATSLIDTRMNMIEKIDTHPLSWPVATEFQKLKRARADDEDDKLFAAAEKKVKEQRKAKNDEAKLKAQTAGRQRMNFMQRPSQLQGRFGFQPFRIGSVAPDQCSFCGVTGHWKKNCYKFQAARGQKSFVSAKYGTTSGAATQSSAAAAATSL